MQMLLTSTLGQFQEPSLHQPPGCWPATVTSDPLFEEMCFPYGCYVTLAQIQSNTLPWPKTFKTEKNFFHRISSRCSVRPYAHASKYLL